MDAFIILSLIAIQALILLIINHLKNCDFTENFINNKHGIIFIMLIISILIIEIIRGFGICI